VAGTFLGADCLASRTGYTGEDGFELIVPGEKAVSAWEALMDAGRVFGILPCGLGARDTLRFEAAMPLYGHEMDETVNPYAVGLGWAVKLDKGGFVGRDALRRFKADPGRTRIGLTLDGKRIPRQGHAVHRDGEAVGVITSGTFAPTLGKALAMALVRPDAAGLDTTLTVDVRGHDEPALVVKLPFYRRTTSPA
jgi:aminomethyltransferase